MNIPHKQLSVDINRKNQYTVDFIGHVNDKDVRYIDVTFNAGGTPITLEKGCTATVTYVSEGVLIDQAAVCVVTGSTVVIGVDSEKVENLRSGILEVQPKVVDPNGRILTMQIPILVRISPDIAEHGQVDDDSLGSYAEVVREIAAARGRYQSLSERLANTAAPTDDQVAEALYDYIDDNPDLFSYATPEQYGAVGDGVTDDTEAVQACIAENTHILLRKSYLINPWANRTSYKFYGLTIPSNRTLTFEKNSEFICMDNAEEATPGAQYDEFSIIKIENAENIVISGLKLKGERRPELIGYGDHSCCLIVSGSKNITIKDSDIYNSLGDGLAIWGFGTEWEYEDGRYKLSENINIVGCTIRESRRNGLTIGCGKNIRVLNCDFLNNGNKVDYGDGVYGYGRKPRAGVDIEPNFAYIPVQDIVFENCYFYGNAKDGEGDPDEQNPEAYSFIDSRPSKPQAYTPEEIKAAVLISRKNLTLINCTIDDSTAFFQAANTNIIGGYFRGIGISSIPTVKVNGATVNKITSAAARNNAVFSACTINGHPDDSQGTITNGGANCWVECFSCKLLDVKKITMANTGTLGLYGCSIYQTANEFIYTGHLIAKDTQFHFEDHSAIDRAVFRVASAEFLNCDFYYPDDKRFELFGLAVSTSSEYYKSSKWIDNRFHNGLGNNSFFKPLGNDLIRNWFYFPTTKLSDDQGITRIGNIFTDFDENRDDKANVSDIPTKTSDLTNDSGFLTQHQDISGKANVSDIPTKTSNLTNDSGFLTVSTLPIYNGGVQ